MAMSVGPRGDRETAEINLTPMIDVLLVLLVIFIIAQPMLQKSLDIQVPKKEPAQNADQIPKIVLEIAADGSITLNTRPIPSEQLEQHLRLVYANREDRILFVKVAPEVLYEDVIAAMDAARGAGVEVIGAVL